MWTTVKFAASLQPHVAGRVIAAVETATCIAEPQDDAPTRRVDDRECEVWSVEGGEGPWVGVGVTCHADVDVSLPLHRRPSMATIVVNEMDSQGIS